jgi:hypothetical protein
MFEVISVAVSHASLRTWNEAPQDRLALTKVVFLLSPRRLEGSLDTVPTVSGSRKPASASRNSRARPLS